MNELLASWHPFVVHFAVALSLTSAALDIVSHVLRRDAIQHTGFLLSCMALPALLLAVLTGNLAYQFLHRQDAASLVEAHQSFANAGVWLFIGAFAWRLFLTLKKKFSGWRRLVYVAVIAAAAVAIFIAAMRGGEIFHRTQTLDHRGSPPHVLNVMNT